MEPLEELWGTAYPSLVSRLLAVTGSRAEAEDVVQDAFAKALVSWRESWPQNPEGWLLTAAVNTARSRWRRARRGEVITRVAHTTHVDSRACPRTGSHSWQRYDGSQRPNGRRLRCTTARTCRLRRWPGSSAHPLAP